ncbi:MAG: cysteine hydrolase [Erysipelotrichaceae bacterium]|nr:cysteine hydrolase [Erysipelotrichaceae bacterium]
MREILIVVDMQKDFVDGSLGTKEAVAIVPSVVKEMKKKYDKVFLTRDTHQPDYLETREGRFLPVVHCVENTSGWQFDKKVGKAAEKLENVEIINKPTFGSEQLIELLKEENEKEAIGRITLIGLCTDICVVSNALMVKAAFPEMDVRVLKDCCAGVTPETHEAALTTMKMCQIVIE